MSTENISFHGEIRKISPFLVKQKNKIKKKHTHIKKTKKPARQKTYAVGYSLEVPC